MIDYLERQIEGKKILWLKEPNRYMLVEMPAYHVISRLCEGVGSDEIAKWCSGFYDLPPDEARRFTTEVIRTVEQQLVPGKKATGIIDRAPMSSPSTYYSQRQYQINVEIFSAQYETRQEEHLIHPKFAHLGVTNNKPANHHFQVFKNGGHFVLRVNGEIIGEWLPGDEHYLSGKFSMEILNRIHNRSESSWMGVFHASAICRNNQSILFLGDSGNGKSTTCAVLMASGFNLLADDFVPVDGLTGNVYSFPAALSVKKNAVAPLLHLYPELDDANEFSYPEMDKKVRFLPPAHSSEYSLLGYSAKALVFVKYKKQSGMKMEKLAKGTAFQKLVPDSWISPVEENAARFLDWFLELPCYQLTYSENDKMVTAIQNIFNDDL